MRGAQVTIGHGYRTIVLEDAVGRAAGKPHDTQPKRPECPAPGREGANGASRLLARAQGSRFLKEALNF
jgi:hypothetical protein